MKTPEGLVRCWRAYDPATNFEVFAPTPSLAVQGLEDMLSGVNLYVLSIHIPIKSCASLKSLENPQNGSSVKKSTQGQKRKKAKTGK